MSGWALFGVGIVQGEVSLLLSATRHGSRWTNHGRSDEDQDPLILGLYKLQEKLNRSSGLAGLDANTFIKPFCQIVQSDDTTGPVTGMAIGSLEKFLAYNLIDPAHASAPSAIESLSDAVTHARFVGTNPASDEVVLMKILQVLRTLLLSPVGRLLTNESVCEIMQSCFRICFEMRLSELLRCFGEGTLVDLVQLLFTRLSSFPEDPQDKDTLDQTLMTPQQETPPPVDPIADSADSPDQSEEGVESHDSVVEATNQSLEEERPASRMKEKRDKVLTPYGLPCVRELLRFLVSIISTEDRHGNADALVAIGLNLVTVVLECGSTHLCSHSGLASLVQDNLCKYLFQLLKYDSFTLFSRSLRCCCLLFQRCRPFLKLQLEMFMNRLMELITVDGSSKSLYEKKELALECVVQLCYTPHFPAELYVNFDCGLYCTNVFENLTKILSKNAFPTQGAILSTHLLSLDALLAIANNLETDNSHLASLKVGGLEEGRVPRQGSNSTQIMSAGIIFSSHLIDTSPPSPSLSLPQMKALSRSHDVIEMVAKNSIRVDDITKSASGYQMAVGAGGLMRGGRGGRGGRRKGTWGEEAPSSRSLLAVRQRKKLILAATDQFNKKPKQGIAFLLEQNILTSPLDSAEVADFLLENPALSKARIGDYVGDRKNVEILETFVSKQRLCEVPMVDALRNFLESFRLPGESPIVERILEAFSRHWLESNQSPGGLGEVFANRDAVHVLSYAVMMLNTDLHSNQVKKKMTLREFIRNQRKTNNGSNYPEQFLDEVYASVKGGEIIMPDEHSGFVRDNYQWKVLLQRSLSGPDGVFTGVTDGEFDQDLFLLSWGPTIAALSYVYDHADDKIIAQKAISGFSNCASVAAHYELKEVFDNLIISLCKFTSLLNTHENSTSLYFQLGVNPKVRQSVHAMFSLAHSYGNILREGWKDLLDCLLSLFKTRLLPLSMIEVFDFLHPEGKISLFRDETPVRTDSSLLSSIYSYWSSSQEAGSSPAASAGSSGGGGRGLSASEGKARSAAMACIQECHPEQLFTESKFLRSEALLELVKALIFASRCPDQHQSLGTHFDEDAAVFFMEILISVAIENRDRVRLFWKDLSSHLCRIISSATPQNHFLLERGVVSVLHLALRLLGRGEFPVIQALSSLHVLLSLPAPAKPPLATLYCQVARGLTELVHTHFTSLTLPQHWAIVFTMLEYTGAGIRTSTGIGTDTGTGIGTESALLEAASSSEDLESPDAAANEPPDWSSTGRSVRFELLWRPEVDPLRFEVAEFVNSFDSLEGSTCHLHEPQAFFKVCECLSYIVRSDHLVTLDNFSACVRCARHLTEIASCAVALDYDKLHTKPHKSPGSRREKASSPTRMDRSSRGEGPKMGGARGDSDTTYTSSLLQLLDLLDAMHSKVARIFDSKALTRLKSSMQGAVQDSTVQDGTVQDSTVQDGTAVSRGEGYCPDVDTACPEKVASFKLEESVGLDSIWSITWCPLLQGMARLCCDSRRSVRQTSITYLQRALLSHDLHNLGGGDWHACFSEVFFPMLTRLMGDIQTGDRLNLEETRVRASNLLCKVFLQHLPSLCQVKDSFRKLWMNILYFMDKFLHLDNSDLLSEAIPESLKNMLLVMTTQGVFDSFALGGATESFPRASHHKTLWTGTWNRIDRFLPGFLSELFPNEKPRSSPGSGRGTPDVGTAEVGTAGSLEVTQKQGREPSEVGGASKSSSPVMIEGEWSGGSGGHTPQSSPPRGSPVAPSASADLDANPAFPVMLHPPLPGPTLTQQGAVPSTTIPIPIPQNQLMGLN